MAKAGLHLSAPCEHCGAAYRQARSDQRFCSKRCGIRYWKDRHAVPVTRPTRECAECKRSFAPRNGKHVFCSPSCGAEANAKARAVVDGPGKQWAAGKTFAPRRLCERCGSLFYAPPVLVRRGGGRFCSNACRGAAIAHDPERWPATKNRRGNGGKRADLGDRYFRSSWEANWARYLNWLVDRGELARWEYEVDTFEFPVKRGSKFYTPDFKLHYADGSSLYHEVKGYMDQRSATKLHRMRRHYPDVEVRLIDKEEYRRVAVAVGAAIPNWERAQGRLVRAS